MPQVERAAIVAKDLLVENAMNKRLEEIRKTDSRGFSDEENQVINGRCNEILKLLGVDDPDESIVEELAELIGSYILDDELANAETFVIRVNDYVKKAQKPKVVKK